jgi:hypothetical protein
VPERGKRTAHLLSFGDQLVEPLLNLFTQPVDHLRTTSFARG